MLHFYLERGHLQANFDSPSLFKHPDFMQRNIVVVAPVAVKHSTLGTALSSGWIRDEAGDVEVCPLVAGLSVDLLLCHSSRALEC